MEAAADYSIETVDGDDLERGEVTVSLTEEAVELRGEATYRFTYRAIRSVDAGEYTVRLTVEPGRTIELTKLGRRYNDFLRELHHRRNAVLLADMLMDEGLRQPGVEAEFQYVDNRRNLTNGGESEVRLYDTAVVVIPRTSHPVRLPYGTIDHIEVGDYRLWIESVGGDVLTLTKLGREFEPFHGALTEVMAELKAETVAMLEDRLPAVDPFALNDLAEMMRDGRAVSRREVRERVGPSIWASLPASLDEAGIRDEYEYLAGLGASEWISIGIKRSLVGELRGDYLWFLVPIVDVDANRSGNAIVMEATGGGAGQATYLFRVLPPADYASIHDPAVLEEAVDTALTTLNRGMLTVNFRREPIYLSDERLAEPRYSRYRSALRLVPELTDLRQRFIGRVVHRSMEQWQRDLSELLSDAQRGSVGMDPSHEPVAGKPTDSGQGV